MMAECQSARLLFEIEGQPLMWALPVIPVAIGTAIILAYYFVREGRSKVLVVSIVVAAMFLSGVILFGNVLPDNALVQAARRRTYRVIEGTVSDLHPQLSGQRAYESFTVSGATFRYSEYETTRAFHQSVGSGGPIRAGMRVRIEYLDGRILKLEECR
jgi:hypothetical protein